MNKLIYSMIHNSLYQHDIILFLVERLRYVNEIVGKWIYLLLTDFIHLDFHDFNWKTNRHSHIPKAIKCCGEVSKIG